MEEFFDISDLQNICEGYRSIYPFVKEFQNIEEEDKRKSQEFREEIPKCHFLYFFSDSEKNLLHLLMQWVFGRSTGNV